MSAQLVGKHAGRIRATILRPSLVWTPSRPAALPPVAAFTVANALGFPGVDKPVRVDILAAAVAAAVAQESALGTWNYQEMEARAAST
jgi:hypothetical protein